MPMDGDSGSSGGSTANQKESNININMDIELDESKEPTADNEKMAAEEDDDTDTSTTTVVNKSSPTKNVGGESAEVSQPITKHTRMGEKDNHNENAVEIGSSGSITQQHNQSSFFSTKPTIFRNKKQDEFVKNGARVKTLVTSTLRAMADGLVANNIEGGLDSSGEEGKGGGTKNSQQRNSTKTELTHAQELAQGKTEECMALKRVRFVILLLQYLFWYTIYHSLTFSGCNSSLSATPRCASSD